MFKTASLTLALVGAVLVGLTAGTGIAKADPIGPGFDLFETIPGDTSVTLPGIGPVPLTGVPFFGGTTVDTVVERLTGLPSGGVGPIQIRLDELFLRSVAPVNLPGVGPADLYATRNFFGIPGIPEPIPLGTPPVGTLTVQAHIDGGPGVGGGTFVTTALPVNVDLIFTRVGGDPNNPADRLLTTTGDFTNPPLTGGLSLWTHTPPPDDPHPFVPSPFSEAGEFYAGISPGPPFADGFPNPPPAGTRLPILESRPDDLHGTVAGMIPEPSSLVLFAAAGVVGVMAFGTSRLFKKA
jgi:hypothetical protein